MLARGTKRQTEQPAPGESVAAFGQSVDNVVESEHGHALASTTATAPFLDLLGNAPQDPTLASVSAVEDHLVNNQTAWGFPDSGIFGQPDDTYFEFSTADSLDAYLDGYATLNDGALPYLDPVRSRCHTAAPHVASNMELKSAIKLTLHSLQNQLS